MNNYHYIAFTFREKLLLNAEFPIVQTGPTLQERATVAWLKCKWGS